MGQLYRNEKIEIYNVINGWAQILFENIEGYVLENLLLSERIKTPEEEEAARIAAELERQKQERERQKSRNIHILIIIIGIIGTIGFIMFNVKINPNPDRLKSRIMKWTTQSPSNQWAWQEAIKYFQKAYGRNPNSNQDVVIILRNAKRFVNSIKKQQSRTSANKGWFNNIFK